MAFGLMHMLDFGSLEDGTQIILLGTCSHHYGLDFRGLPIMGT